MTNVVRSGVDGCWVASAPEPVCATRRLAPAKPDLAPSDQEVAAQAAIRRSCAEAAESLANLRGQRDPACYPSREPAA